MQPCQAARIVRRNEDGYVLAGVIVLLAIFMILMAMAVPKVRDEIRRDKEVETMHRGRQYIRAVQLYYRRFSRFPPDVNALEDTDGMRFLRKRYADPLTGQDDWQPVVLGQNKAPLSIGFFGQVLNMGAAVSAENGTAPASSILGKPPASAFDSFSNPSDSSANSNQSPGGSANPGSVFGGAIIGFSPAGEKESILVYKTKTHYNEWEFVYDPMTDSMVRNWWAPPPIPPTNTGAPGVGPSATSTTP